MAEAPSSLRIDKWLWAARFFKSRSLAAKAVDAGQVRVGEERVKPARELKSGETLHIRIGDTEFEVRVLGLAAMRGPAAQAALLYEESAGSRARREASREKRRIEPEPAAGRVGRPTKRDRRLIHRFTGDG